MNILLYNNLNKYDTEYFLFSLFVHMWFYIGIYYNNRILLKKHFLNQKNKKLIK